MTRVSIIVASSVDDNIIGVDGELPWHIPHDLRRFKAFTEGHMLVMGRLTWESLPKKPLPNRDHVVLSRDLSWRAPGAVHASSLKDALNWAKLTGADEVYVIGGEEVYKEAIGIADRILWTRVFGRINAIGSVLSYFPEPDCDKWKVSHTEIMSDHQFLILER